MKLVNPLLFAALILPLSLHGAVESVIIRITTNSPYAVPQGKVLIIENVKQRTFYMALTSGTNRITMNSDDFMGNQMGSIREPYLRLPLKVSGGWTVEADLKLVEGPTPFYIPGDFWVFGVLLDSVDLFASIPNKIDQLAVQGGIVSLGVQTTTTRPAKVTVEKSPTLDGAWEPAPVASITTSVGRTNYLVTLPAQGNQEFFRAKATAIR